MELESESQSRLIINGWRRSQLQNILPTLQPCSQRSVASSIPKFFIDTFQVVVGDSRTRLDVGGTDPLRSGTPTQHIVIPPTTGTQQATAVTASSSTQQVVVSASGAVTQPRLGIGGQQIVVPASALAGSQLNLKRLQAFQSFKVVPASQLSQQQQQRGRFLNA